MGFIKHSTGIVLPEEDDGQRKTAADTTFDEQDQKELEQENKQADQ